MELTDPKKVKEKLNQVGCGFCLAKWTQVTIHLGSGLNHSCHHVKAHTIPINEVEENPQLLHNTMFKKNTRQQMKSGERPSECDYCWRIEDNTDHYSDRIWKSRNYWSWPDYHKIVNSNAYDDFYPRYVEVSFSNVCNFKCSYCGPAFSSKWTEEIKEHGHYKFSTINWFYNQLDEYQKQIPEREDNPYINAFWKWFPEAVKHMHTFRITGGEPLLSKHTDKVLQHLIDNPQPQLEFSINTNACPPGKLWNKFIKKIQHLENNNCIKGFTLHVSAESKGAQAEYSRTGMNWQQFYDNVLLYLKNTNGKLSFMSAFNILSFPTFRPFLGIVLRLRNSFKNRVRIAIPYVRNPGFLDAMIATEDMIETYLIPCIKFMEENFDEHETNDLKRIVQDLDKRFKNPEEFGSLAKERRFMFYEFITQFDKRRGTDFLTVFPELKNFYKECKQCTT